MGLDPKDLDTVVLSHGHLDHTGGLVALVRIHTGATIEGERGDPSRTVPYHPVT
jgi:7,8-dihydropterin-6-yl-methyl-4-(beta-D-ribofuranosyl)aminobenzene 5'-phosphate synthase